MWPPDLWTTFTQKPFQAQHQRSYFQIYFLMTRGGGGGKSSASVIFPEGFPWLKFLFAGYVPCVASPSRAQRFVSVTLAAQVSRLRHRDVDAASTDVRRRTRDATHCTSSAKEAPQKFDFCVKITLLCEHNLIFVFQSRISMRRRETQF